MEATCDGECGPDCSELCAVVSDRLSRKMGVLGVQFSDQLLRWLVTEVSPTRCSMRRAASSWRQTGRWTKAVWCRRTRITYKEEEDDTVMSLYAIDKPIVIQCHHVILGVVVPECLSESPTSFSWSDQVTNVFRDKLILKQRKQNEITDYQSNQRQVDSKTIWGD